MLNNTLQYVFDIAIVIVIIVTTVIAVAHKLPITIS